MSRIVSRSNRVFLVAMGITLVLALLPTSWLGWTSGLAEIVNVPVQPFADAGVRLRDRLRPPNDPLAGESDKVQHLIEEFEKARALSQRKQLRIEALEEEIRELQDAQRFHRGQAVEIDTLFARISGRSPDRAGGLVRLNMGSREGVVGGTVAVFRGVHLVGRVASDVSRLSSWLVPLTDPTSGLVEAVILPADDRAISLESAPRVQLAPDGTGGLVGDLDKAVVVRRGDVVRLSDPAWPKSAWGMIVGFVESMSDKERQPLLSAVLVRPRYHAHRLSSVTLKIERPAALSEGRRP